MGKHEDQTNDDDQFAPNASIDKQIERLAHRSDQPERSVSANARLIQDLSQAYIEEEQILDDVWRRLAAYAEDTVPMISETRRLSPVRRQRREPVQRFGLLIAGLVAILVVGSMLLLARNDRISTPVKPQQATPQPTQKVATASGVYIGGSDGLYKVDHKTGKVLWHFTFGDHLVSNLMVAGETVYAVEASTRLYAIDGKSGDRLWSHDFQKRLSDPIMANGLIYVGGFTSHDTGSSLDRGDIYALDAHNGFVRATYPLPIINLSRGVGLVAVNNVLYVSAREDTFAFALGGGNQLWHLSSPQDWEFSTTPKIVGGVLYSTMWKSIEGLKPAQESYVYAYDASSGREIWRSNLVPEDVFRLTVDSDRIYYAAPDGGSPTRLVHALNRETGKEIWSRDVGGIVVSDPIAVGDTVYVNVGRTTSGQGKKFESMVALSAIDGSVNWRKEKALDSFITPVFQNGLLYLVGPDQEGVTALNIATNVIIWHAQIGSQPTAIAVIP